MKIINYKDANNILVKFQNDTIISTTYRDFKNGTTINPYDKVAYGVGFMGEGKYVGWHNSTATIQYINWNNMLKRCYNKKDLDKKPTYKGVTVCEEWHNFQVFAKWFDENYYKVDGERMQLDKDILHKGNKVYSPENCVFVPSRINILFVKCDKLRGDYPIGVCYMKANKKFMSSCGKINDGKRYQCYLGLYNTSEEAFYIYKKEKEKYIKEVANEYKNKIPNKLYKAMYDWVVEITD